MSVYQYRIDIEYKGCYKGRSDGAPTCNDWSELKLLQLLRRDVIHDGN